MTRMLTKLGWCAVAIAWFGACDSGGSSTDGNTTWLTLCNDGTACAAGLTCSCGVCTKSCDSEAACADLGSGAACVNPALLGSACASTKAPTGPVCMKLCVSATDCSPGLSCVAGFCSAPSNSDASVDNGGSGSGGGGGKTGNGGASAGNGGGTGNGGDGTADGGDSSGGATSDGGVDQADASASGGNAGIDGGSSAGSSSTDATTGDATSTDGGSPEATPVAFVGDAGKGVITSIAAGRYHACAVLNGGVQCWGRNDEKQLGNAAAGGYSTVPVPVNGLGCEVTNVCAGLHHTCALSHGRISCWGSNTLGQLGTNTVAGSTSVPTAIPLVTEVEAIACGQNHTCALRRGGVFCWGDNSYDQLGQPGGPAPGTGQVQNLAPGSGATAVFANGNNSCAIVNGGLECWGDDTWGQLGNGVTGVSAFAPYQAPELATGVTAVSVGNGEFICAAVNGAVSCSGRTFYDLNPQTWQEHHTFTPVAKPFDSGVQSLSGGYEFSCGILSGGAYCWGVGTVAHFTAGPNIVGLDTGVAQIASGDYYACVLKDNQVYCWGWDMDGQLGRGVVGAGGYAQPVVDLVATPACPYGHCLDQVQDDGETAVDCGGECGQCYLGQGCTVDGDCQSNACDSVSKQCISTYCSDHHQDGDETDADCGGRTCGQCINGKKCTTNFDCLSGFCGGVPTRTCQ